MRIVTLAHQVEAMARQKKLEDLAFYLKPLRKHRTADEGLAAVTDLLDRKIEKQDRAATRAKKSILTGVRPKPRANEKDS